MFKAYYLLEARGLIRARDRSGSYVLRAPHATLPAPDGLSSASAGRHPVDVSDNVLQVLNATLRRDMLPFGSAFPSPSLLPYGRLAKFMAATVQRLDPWGSIDDLSRATPRCAGPSRCATSPTGCRCRSTTSSSPTAP